MTSELCLKLNYSYISISVQIYLFIVEDYHSILLLKLFEELDRRNIQVVVVVDALMYSRNLEIIESSFDKLNLTFKIVDEGDGKTKFDFGAGTKFECSSIVNSCKPPKCPN
jgi:hypothetical protein